MATAGTKSVNKFAAVLRADDGEAFRISEYQGGFMDLECTVKVPGGSYEGRVRYIEAKVQGADSWLLWCWFHA